MIAASTTVLHHIRSVELPKITGHDAFVAYLKFGHGIMRASASLLELAITKAQGALREYYANHLEEERDHAAWLAQDLHLLGEVPPKIDHAAAATAGAQYYYLHHVGPHALLGYIAALEFRPMPIEEVEGLERLYGKPAMRTVRHHAVHDLEHSKELARVIDLHEQFADVITYSAFVTTKMLAYYLADRMKGAT